MIGLFNYYRMKTNEDDELVFQRVKEEDIKICGKTIEEVIRILQGLEFENNIIVFSDVIKVSKYWQRDIYNISIKNEKIRNLLMTFKENKIFYASDLCGTDFKQVIDFQIRR